MTEARRLEADGASVAERIEQAEQEIRECISILRRIGIFEPSRRSIQAQLDMARLRVAMLREGEK